MLRLINAIHPDAQIIVAVFLWLALFSLLGGAL